VLADPQRFEVAPVNSKDTIHSASLGNRRDDSINQTEIQLGELCVDVQSTHDVNRQDMLVFVSRRRIEDLCHEPAHGGTLVSQKVVDLGEN